VSICAQKDEGRIRGMEVGLATRRQNLEWTRLHCSGAEKRISMIALVAIALLMAIVSRPSVQWSRSGSLRGGALAVRP